MHTIKQTGRSEVVKAVYGRDEPWNQTKSTIYTRIIRAYFFRNLAKKNWGVRNIWNKVGTALPLNKWSRHELKSEVRITC